MPGRAWHVAPGRGAVRREAGVPAGIRAGVPFGQPHAFTDPTDTPAKMSSEPVIEELRARSAIERLTPLGQR
ncbi:hypothetical protein ACFY9S_25120 [Streptomyces sp. NPDC012474]|uniref:hypothetical protein n=1 Tax=Streptomyces sp. NPDC012474 TaxID=3364836 RepID=UPI0036E0BDB3